METLPKDQFKMMEVWITCSSKRKVMGVRFWVMQGLDTYGR